MLSFLPPRSRDRGPASAATEVQRTLSQLKTFYDSHAFDTDGPYADLFAVLLSTCRHLIDANVAQQARLDAIDGNTRQVQEETAVLCEQSAKANLGMRDIREDLERTQRSLRALAAADCERAASGSYDNERSSTSIRTERGEDEDLHHFARWVRRRLHLQDEAHKALSTRVQRLGEQLTRMETAQHSTQKQVDKLAHQTEQHGRQSSSGSPLRPLEALSEAVGMATEDHYRILQRRLAEMEENQDTFRERLARLSAAMETANTTSGEAQRGITRALSKTQERVEELVAAFQKSNMRQEQQRRHQGQEPSQTQTQTPPRLPPSTVAPAGPHIAVLGTSGSRSMAFVEEDFVAPSPAKGSGGGQDLSPAQQRQEQQQQNTGGKGSAVDAVWQDWLSLLRSIRAGDKAASSLPSPAAAVARELQALLRDSSTAPAVSALPSSSPSPNGKVSGDALGALADQLDTLSGRVEVLEVYAPHTYAIATRPPLLGLELADRVEGNGNRGGGAVQVTNVFAGCLADEAGISPGDQVLSLDGVTVSSRAELYVVLRERTRTHQALCQLVTQNGFLQFATGKLNAALAPALSSTGEEDMVASVQRELPRMNLSLVVKRGDEAREVVLSLPASVCWPQPSW